MGCDGGTIPKRDELVKKKKKEEKVGKEDSRNVKWRNCAMSQSTLEKPIVACELGRIFNKESVINFLIQKKSSPEKADAVFSYIRNLRDVKELKLTPNPAYKDDIEKAGQSQKEAQFICPFTGLEMNGSYRFVFLWSCGCVFSERALKEIKDGVCVACSQSYTDEDIIPFNPSEEEKDGLMEKMTKRRAKNITKNKRKKTEVEATDHIAPAYNEEAEPSSKIPKISSASCSSTEASKYLKQSTATKTLTGQSEAPKKYKTIQDDPSASEAYKSIFNTHSSAKNQAKAHWVTCNPFYY